MNHRIGIASAIAATALVALASPAQANKPIPHAPFVHVVAGADWTWLQGNAQNTPRWNPCAPVTWSAPHDGHLVEKAAVRGIAKLAKFTGYTFQRVEDGADIAITVVNADDADVIGADGYTVQSSAPVTGGDLSWLTGVRVGIWDGIATDREMVSKVMLHELGHAVGLGHAADVRQIMYPTVGVTTYGAGDRAGLASVRPGGCEPEVAAGTAVRTSRHIVY